MKHLKKFNESILGDELKNFVKYLAYLTDGKFECYVNSNSTNTHITILDRDHSGKGRVFLIGVREIEDDFIPFLQNIITKICNFIWFLLFLLVMVCGFT
jgi:hypothetical protein